MRTVRLGRTFDAVFVHDAVSYLTTEGDLRAAMETAFVHCRPGGAALFVPDFVRETFSVPRIEHGRHDGEGRALRYLMWAWDPDPDDSTYLADFAYLLRDADGTVTVEHDRHVLGVFPRATWLGLLEETGFRPEIDPPNTATTSAPNSSSAMRSGDADPAWVTCARGSQRPQADCRRPLAERLTGGALVR